MQEQLKPFRAWTSAKGARLAYELAQFVRRQLLTRIWREQRPRHDVLTPPFRHATPEVRRQTSVNSENRQSAG